MERLDWKKCRERFRGKPFVSIDPGAQGYALGWIPECPLPVAYCHALEPHLVATLVASSNAPIVVWESQYVTSLKNARHILELTFRAGMSLGVTAECLRREGIALRLTEVSPSTWQAHQRRTLGLKGQAKRGEGIKTAVAVAKKALGKEREWPRSSAEEKRGIASAYGIGMWWRGE
jgi:hypothetical protein